MSTEPLDEIQWKSPEWIQQFGLFTGNVLDYFAESPFYDRTSNNQVLRMQFQYQPPPNNINPQKYFESKLKEMTGTEFFLLHIREPDFWIIRKQKRLNSENAIPLQDYYIIGANVYQAPKIYDILSSRLLSSVLSIKKSINLLDEMSSFSIQDGGHVFSTGQNSTEARRNNTTAVGSTVNTVTPMMQTPYTATETDAASSTNNPPPMLNNEISSSAFDSLLSDALLASNENGAESVYLDNIPLYGKGSTVEALGLKVNLESED